MDMQVSVMKGAAFMAGMGAELFGATETVIGGGHYVADGLRKVADGIDWVTDQGQEFCHDRKIGCAKRKSDVLAEIKSMVNTEVSEDEMAKMQKMAEEMISELQNAAKGNKEIEDAEFKEVKPEPKKARPVVADDAILV